MLIKILLALSIACPWLTVETRTTQAEHIAAAVDTDLDGALLLVTIGAIESGYQADIESCHCKPGQCDDGEALGSYQLHKFWWAYYSRNSICTDPKLATRLAYNVVKFLRHSSKNNEDLLRRYVGQNVRFNDPRVIPRNNLYKILKARIQ